MKWEDILKFTPPFSAQLMGRLVQGNIEMFQMYDKMIIVRGGDDKSFYDVLNMGDNEKYMSGFRVRMGIEHIIKNIVQTREELREFVREYSEYITVLSYLDSRLHLARMDMQDGFPRMNRSMDLRNTTEVPIPIFDILTREEKQNIENIDFGIYDLPVPEFDSGSRQLYDEFIYIYKNLEADL